MEELLLDVFGERGEEIMDLLSAFNEHNPDSAVSFRRNGDVVERRAMTAQLPKRVL